MNKALKDYTREEWEAVCNRCGKCCLVKIQDDETDEIFYTDVVCRYMDMETCTCTRYDERCTLVPSCLKLTPENINKIDGCIKASRNETAYSGSDFVGGNQLEYIGLYIIVLRLGIRT